MQNNYYGSLGELYLKDINSKTVQAWVNEFAINHSPQDRAQCIWAHIDRGRCLCRGYQIKGNPAAEGTTQIICALTADDVNGNILSVNKAMVDKGNNEWVIKTTKNITSTKLVEMPEFVVKKFPDSGRLVNITRIRLQIVFRAHSPNLKLRAFVFMTSGIMLPASCTQSAYQISISCSAAGWSSDRTLKAIYRGTIEEYTQKYTDMTLSHFENMQHEKENP